MDIIANTLRASGALFLLASGTVALAGCASFEVAERSIHAGVDANAKVVRSEEPSRRVASHESQGAGLPSPQPGVTTVTGADLVRTGRIDTADALRTLLPILH